MQLKFFLAASAASVSLACGLMAVPAAAQQITTGIQGTVNDDGGKPIPGATVTVTDTRTGAARTTTTGEAGTFAVTNLTTGGPYSVHVEAGGYEGQTIDGVNTTLQGDTNLGFKLSSGGGTIVVTAARVTVTQLAVGPGQSFGTAVLSTAPSFNRDVRDIIRLDPRVSLDRDDGGSGQDRISCLGGNDRGNTFTVDGFPQSDIYGLNDTGFSSRSSTPLPYDAIRETQVQFAPFDVEYGAFTGCSINVVTKSGTNQFHGGGFYEYSDAGTRGDHLDNHGITVNVAPIKPDKHWGVSLGGPVIKDRIFLFGAYEHEESGQSQDEGPSGAGFATDMAITATQFQQISDAIKSIYGVDTGPLVHNRPYKNDRYFGRADIQLTDKHRLEFTYQHLEESTLKADDLFSSGSNQAIVGENTFYLSGTKSDYYSGRLYSDWNDRLSTELRYAHAHVQDLQDPFGGGEAQSSNPIPRIIVGLDNPTGNDIVVVAGPGRSRTANDLRTTVEQYRATVKYDADKHKIKFGIDLNRAHVFNLFLQDATGTLVFRNLADLQAGLLSPGTGSNQTSTTASNVISGATEGAFGNFTPSGDVNTAAADLRRDNLAFFAQDDWQVSDRLSVVAGVRIDWFSGNHPAENPNFYRRYGITNATGFEALEPIVEPRLGITYDVPDFAVFSRAQLHGGVGIFSGGDPLVWFGNAFQNNGQAFGLGSLQAPGICPTQSSTFQYKVLDANGKFTGVPACIKTAGGALGAQGNAANQSVDPDLKVPTVFRANIGFQANLDFAPTGFFSGWQLNLDYIYSRYENPFNVVDLAQAIDVRKGLSGYMIDGRPIYAAIDPIAAGCSAKLVSFDPTPTYTGLSTACYNTSRGADLMLTNAGSFRSHNASVILSKYSNHGIFTEGGSTFFSLGYAYSDSHDRRNMYNSTASSNYGITAAFDRQNPDESPGFYQSKHNISVGMNWAETLFSDLKTSLGLTFVARGGRPYSLTFTGNGTFNSTNQGLTTADTALFYVPTGPGDPNVVFTDTLDSKGNVVTTAAQNAARLDSFISGLPCANKYRGRSIPRNTCTNDWYKDMDLTVSQELPGPGRLFGRHDKIKLYATIDNFLNLLNPGWNLQRRRSFMGVQDLAFLGRSAVTSGSTTIVPAVPAIDAQGRYVFGSMSSLDTFTSDNQINVSSSVWRLKVGISYNF